MLKKAVRQLLACGGYEIRRIPLEGRSVKSAIKAQGFTLHKYVRPDGTFDYEAYKRIQTEGNKRKLEVVGVLEDNIAFLSKYVQRMVPRVNFGICHGTRRGMEQAWFRKYLGCEVIGTEISETAAQFPHTIQWDFHEVKPEWIDSVDFIYSNAFDHSYDPQNCLNAWMQCLRKGGICIIEHGSGHGPSGSCGLDPFGADFVLMPYLITLWGNGRYGVREILTAPSKTSSVSDLHFIVVLGF